MARRKRASMREGPLADLFRSTVEPEDPPAPPPAPGRDDEETRVMPSEGAVPQDVPERHDAGEPPTPAHPDPPVPTVEETPDPERVHAYRVEEHEEPVPAKERLSRIFDDRAEPDAPFYGRDEPERGGPIAPPRPHAPVIRVVGVGGAGVNAVN